MKVVDGLKYSKDHEWVKWTVTKQQLGLPTMPRIHWGYCICRPA